MSNKEIIIKILKSFIQVVWKMKFITISFFWFILAIIWMLEPFFYAKIIELIEVWYKSSIYDYDTFINVFIFWWIFIIFSSTYFYLYRYYLIDKNVLDYHESLYRKWSNIIIWMHFWEYLNKKQWALFKKFDRWISDHSNFLFFFFLDFIKNVSWLILIATILFYIDYRMAFATFLMVPVMVLIWFYFNSKTNWLQNEVNKDWYKSYWYMWDAISNMQLIKTLVLEKVFSKMMKKIDDQTIVKQKKVSKRWAIADIYTSLVVMLSRFIVLGYWIFLLSNDEINFAILFLFFSFIWYIYLPLSFIFSKLRNIQEQLTSVRNFYEEFWDLESDLHNDLSDNKDLENIKWDIEFRKVNFWYDNKILKNLSFKIQAWEKIAFVWDTWAGKSTIVNLLFRFWNIKSWEILLDWKNINNFTKKSLRENIWIVMQDNSLFNLSIKENLLFAKPDSSEEELKEALKNAQAKFVFDLEDWIHTIIWERWLKLSWWEKQRLSIARLFLKNPKILVLDEATSALDNKTEKLVQKALDKLMKWRTSIVIAHRLSTIQNADRIFMLENWKIIEEWNYEELMNKKDKFFKLANPEHLIIN